MAAIGLRVGKRKGGYRGFLSPPFSPFRLDGGGGAFAEHFLAFLPVSACTFHQLRSSSTPGQATRQEANTPQGVLFSPSGPAGGARCTRPQKQPEPRAGTRQATKRYCSIRVHEKSAEAKERDMQRKTKPKQYIRALSKRFSCGAHGLHSLGAVSFFHVFIFHAFLVRRVLSEQLFQRHDTEGAVVRQCFWSSEGENAKNAKGWTQRTQGRDGGARREE